MNTQTLPEQSRPSGRLFVALGLAAGVLGIVAYLVQVSVLNRLSSPWYMPALATLGVGLVLVSLMRRRSIWRFLALGVALFVAVGTWGMLLGTPLPAYTGPLEVGKPFPAFRTVTAAGVPFTQQDLVGDTDSVLVFFRGRW